MNTIGLMCVGLVKELYLYRRQDAELNILVKIVCVHNCFLLCQINNTVGELEGFAYLCPDTHMYVHDINHLSPFDKIILLVKTT